MSELSESKHIEEEMAAWLAHPREFGVRPTTVRLLKTYHASLVGYGDCRIHLVAYRMPDGSTGRGFVNPPLTWSFLGPEVNAITDDDLLVAYCGWAWLFTALQNGSAETVAVDASAHDDFLQGKRADGYASVSVDACYRVGDVVLVEFTATKDGVSVKGAGNSDTEVIIPSSDARFALPPIFFLLGPEVIIDVR